MVNLKHTSKKRLLEEYDAYKQQIEQIGCYGVRDVMWFVELEREVSNRGLL